MTGWGCTNQENGQFCPLTWDFPQALMPVADFHRKKTRHERQLAWVFGRSDRDIVNHSFKKGKGSRTCGLATDCWRLGAWQRHYELGRDPVDARTRTPRPSRPNAYDDVDRARELQGRADGQAERVAPAR